MSKSGSVQWRSVSILVAAILVAAAGIGCENQRATGPSGAEAEAVESNESEEPTKTAREAEKPAAAEASSESEKTGEDDAPKKATLGEAAPEFTLTDASGEKHSLSEYRGKTVVLEWTSTECPFVKRHYEAETMTGTLEELGGSEDVVWLAIDSSHFASAEESAAWKEKYDAPYPILIDSAGRVGRMYGAKTTPHMYVIDKEGVLRYKGAIDDDERGRKGSPTNYVLQAVEALESGESVEPRSTKPYGCSVKYGS